MNTTKNKKRVVTLTEITAEDVSPAPSDDYMIHFSSQDSSMEVSYSIEEEDVVQTLQIRSRDEVQKEYCIFKLTNTQDLIEGVLDESLNLKFSLKRVFGKRSQEIEIFNGEENGLLKSSFFFKLSNKGNLMHKNSRKTFINSFGLGIAIIDE